jgi:dCTP deaminase
LLLNHTELKWLCTLEGVVTNVTPDLINGTSIDVTLGNEILTECPGPYEVELGENSLYTQRQQIPEAGYRLAPGEFVLACTQQMFNLPLTISCEYRLKSSMARIGLEHLKAGWCDPGWHGSVLTLELKNDTQYHTIFLKPGMRIGQVVFFRHNAVKEEHSYRNKGKYNNHKSVEGAQV